MSVWKKKIIGGIERVFKDGRAVMDKEELDNLPTVVRRMDVGDSLEFEDQAPLPPETPETERPSKLTPPVSEPHVSIISGEPATKQKFLNGQVYWLTEEESKQYNLGKLAQFIREHSTETVEENNE